MPAVNVATTDTFEIQRLKINQIGDQIFNISQGGSDLATGNLKLGDGTKENPSLAFVSNNSLGIFKSDNDEISFVSGGKDISTFKTDSSYFYQNLNIRKRNLLQSGIVIQNPGRNYDTGIYSDIGIIQGSGVGGTFNFTVEAFGGVINNQGSGYLTGSYTDISFDSSGSGTGILAEFSTFSPEIGISNPGSGYLDGEYFSIPTISSGLGENLTVNLTFSGGSAISVTVADAGSRHLSGDTFTVDNASIPGFDPETAEELPNPGTGLELIVSNNPNSIDPESLNFTSKGEGHAVGDLLTTPSGTISVVGDLPGIVEGLSTTLSTLSSTITVSSTAGILAGMDVSQVGGDGQLSDFTTVLSVDSSTEITLSQVPAADGTADLNFSTPSLSSITLSSVSGILLNSLISGGGYSGIVSSVDPENNIITISPDSLNATENVSFTISPPYGSGSGFEYEIENVGVITEAIVSEIGNGYAIGDVLTVRSADLSQPITIFVNVYDGQEIVVSSPIPVSVGDVINTYTPPDPEAGTPAIYGNDLEVIEITAGSNGSASAFVASGETALSDGTEFVINSSGTVYTVSTAVVAFRYYLGFDENNLSLTPNLTLYSGSKYNFLQTDGSFSSHPIKFSPHPDGSFNTIENISTTLSTTSNVISVADSSGILPKMIVSVSSGTGTLSLSTTVESVDGNNITLSELPTSDGSVTLTFTGVTLTENITSTDGSTIITISEVTDNPLYYFCNNHTNVGGELTINLNNPKIFGSDLEILLDDVQITDIIKGEVSDGTFNFIKGISTEIETETLSSSVSINSPTAILDQITSNSITSENSTDLNLSSPEKIILSSQNIEYGSIVFNSSNNSITTSGDISSSRFISNNKLTISDNIISSSSNEDIFLTPAFGRVAKIDSITALTIPSGNTSQRPEEPLAENGSIRFNIETNQYEGYSGTTSSWSSLGGVRDLDGNTYILAEETVGSNDNTLWFINDNINTFKFTRNYQEFVNVKKLRSVNTSAPDYVEWAANFPVTTGDYLKYRNNIYEVTADGVTGTSGNEPTDITGDPFTNGTATLQYFTTAVAPLTFEEISELRVDPLGFTDLVVNGELRFSNNVISTDISDLLIRPNAGQKVTVDSNTSLVIPVGDNNSRGNAARGSIRFNTSILQYEGYDGTNWSSLGGVRDVDGNTYIIPELSPGSNENTLFFYNNNENTLRVTTTQIELDTIDTFASVTSDALNFNAATLTFDNLATTLDNTSSTETFLFSTKDNFDFGLSVGLTTDPLVRLTTDGEIFYNSGFGTGSYDGLRLLDGDLKQFELSDVKLVTFKTTLDKGTINQGAAILYNPSIHESAKVQIVAHNTTTGDKEFIEYSVVDNGTDIFYTDFGNIKTGEELISTEFDFNASSEVRVTFIANTNLNNGDQIDITVVSNIIKR